MGFFPFFFAEFSVLFVLHWCITLKRACSAWFHLQYIMVCIMFIVPSSILQKLQTVLLCIYGFNFFLWRTASTYFVNGITVTVYPISYTVHSTQYTIVSQQWHSHAFMAPKDQGSHWQVEIRQQNPTWPVHFMVEHHKLSTYLLFPFCFGALCRRNNSFSLNKADQLCL